MKGAQHPSQSPGQSPARVTERPDPQNADSDNKKQLDNVTESYTTQAEFQVLLRGMPEHGTPTSLTATRSLDKQGSRLSRGNPLWE